MGCSQGQSKTACYGHKEKEDSFLKGDRSYLYVESKKIKLTETGSRLVVAGRLVVKWVKLVKLPFLRYRLEEKKINRTSETCGTLSKGLT